MLLNRVECSSWSFVTICSHPGGIFHPAVFGGLRGESGGCSSLAVGSCRRGRHSRASSRFKNLYKLLEVTTRILLRDGSEGHLDARRVVAS